MRKALSDFDVASNLVISGSWEIPGYHGKMKAAEWAARGWQFGTILTAASGLPFTANIAGDPLGTKSSVPYDYPDRKNIPGCNNPINPGNPNGYIKLSCFAATIPGNRLGDSGRNVGIGPGLLGLDTSLFKNNYFHRIGENFNVQFRAELFNVLNHTNFGAPTQAAEQLFTVNLAAIPSAGTLTSTSTSSRQIQMAIKIIW